ncbi:DUF5071 domain-containing protein [Mucilaginibacter lappiensis]|uniref:DUF5071 domain-containing protein n=1 Tax=Mucilaginibacter lappiensis TaxID=354630 RepID=A0A841JBQ7_9SPHI|nr:DUF5071 domain-containing protein [Mucilaginibacter lappiensis]MBB6128337.1 hypothetical protein [Mucilaginibacter lappiensis]
MKNYIPKAKDDTKYAKYLKALPLEAVLADVPELLVWLQDLHWDAAQGVAMYFRPYVNEIKRELIEILSDNDAEWKLGVMTVMAYSTNKLDQELITALKYVADHPTEEDQEQSLDNLAKEIIAQNLL